MRIGIVTGASRGIGKVFAHHLADLHYELDEVWCISRSAVNLGSSANSVNSSKYKLIQLDQSKPDFYEKLRQKVVDAKAEVIFLVLNAASAMAGTVLDQRFDDVDRMVQTNIRGTLAAAYAVAPLMPEGGRIVLVSSISAYAPTPGLAVYTATKGFILQWGLSLRRELERQGVSVTIVLPGKVRTSALENVVKQAQSWKLRLMPFQNVDYLVRHSLRAAERGRAIVTPGFYSAVVLFFKLAPTRLITYFSSLVGK